MGAGQGASDAGWIPLSGGESNDGGGDGYESTGEAMWVGLVALGGVIVIWRFVCGWERAYEGGMAKWPDEYDEGGGAWGCGAEGTAGGGWEAG